MFSAPMSNKLWNLYQQQSARQWQNPSSCHKEICIYYDYHLFDHLHHKPHFQFNSGIFLFKRLEKGGTVSNFLKKVIMKKRVTAGQFRCYPFCQGRAKELHWINRHRTWHQNKGREETKSGIQLKHHHCHPLMPSCKRLIRKKRYRSCIFGYE